MRSITERAGQYRQRAKELRNVADTSREINARVALFEAAEDYEWIADRLERRLNPFEVAA